MVETAETAKTPEISKRAKWEKIKRELMKAPKLFPEIVAIAIDYKYEMIKIIVQPVSIEYEMKLYNIGRKFRYKYDVPFDNFSVLNLSSFPAGPWKNLVSSEYKIIYERSYNR